MKFVIIGYGRVGIRTARILREEGHEVIVVDESPEKVRRAESDGFETIEGDGSEDSTLEQADLETVDAVGGLTGDLNANFAACMIGKHHGCRTVLRIDEDYRHDIYRKYADDVDEVIYPERLGAAGAKTALLGGDFNVVSDLTEKLQLSVFRVGESAAGKQIHDVDLPERARIYAHGRKNESLTIPLPGTTLNEGDQVAVIVETDSIETVKTALAG
ncbi:potassium channel family protein [Natronoarchaeum sp. GCM10025703]|uniref:potassium channel family protein n=1 Tax=unclassified Natronoarchaeum TaxID=2620183 RepID=UPI00360CCF94